MGHTINSLFSRAYELRKMESSVI